MQRISPASRRIPAGSAVGATLVGGGLVVAGLALAFLAIDTPMVSRLAPGARAGSDGLTLALLVWALAIIAGGGLLVAGTSRLALALTAVRARSRRRSPAAKALAALPGGLTVATGVVPGDGRAIPAVVIGPFGLAVVHELGEHDVIRQVGASWEMRTRDGWVLAEHPLDRAARDADRVRHWLAGSELDFVVRVYSAVVTTDATIVRTPVCAVITADQIREWIAALPPQRSLSAARRNHLSTRVRAAGPTGDARRDGS